MNKTVKLLLLILACVLILGGIGAAVFALITAPEKESTDNDGATTTEVIHDDIEYIYNEDGTVKSEIYYKDNKYNGQKDYYKGEKDEYITIYNADGEITESSVSKFNGAGSLTSVTTYKSGKIYESTEYDYYDDLRTLAKKTVKTYEGEDELAEKTYYNENGKKTRTCKYLNGSLTEEIYFDESGNVIENGGETVEE